MKIKLPRRDSDNDKNDALVATIYDILRNAEIRWNQGFDKRLNALDQKVNKTLETVNILFIFLFLDFAATITLLLIALLIKGI